MKLRARGKVIDLTRPIVPASDAEVRRGLEQLGVRVVEGS